MKKVITLSIFIFLLLGLAFAVPINNNSKGIGQNVSQAIQEKKQEFKEGNFTGPQGQFLQVREIVQGLKELRTNNQTATTKLNITKETENNETRLKVKLSNGSEKEIKIMPDTAAERALERLRLKVCNETNNCTIELKDVPAGKVQKLAYELQIQRHYKILGLFKAKAENKAEIDAETGQVTITKKPWWAFLATQD